LIRDHWRRVKPEESLDKAEVAFAAEFQRLRQPQFDALDEVQRRETAAALLEALEQLPPVSAQLLKQRSAEGLTLEEAGQRLGLSPAAARAAASRAYKKLRDLLKRDDD
jgi:RNA polymerase sigma factor (sigma-70 family)